MAVMAIAEDITTAIDDNQYTVGVFINLSNFDTIDYKLLLLKLKRLDVCAAAHAWWKATSAIETSMCI